MIDEHEMKINTDATKELRKKMKKVGRGVKRCKVRFCLNLRERAI